MEMALWTTPTMIPMAEQMLGHVDGKRARMYVVEIVIQPESVNQ